MTVPLFCWKREGSALNHLPDIFLSTFSTNWGQTHKSEDYSPVSLRALTLYRRNLTDSRR